jgi:hypothetical protein
VIEADRQVLTAVVGNLLQNAFKFTRPRTVTLRVGTSADGASKRTMAESMRTTCLKWDASSSSTCRGSQFPPWRWSSLEVPPRPGSGRSGHERHVCREGAGREGNPADVSRMSSAGCPGCETILIR